MNLDDLLKRYKGLLAPVQNTLSGLGSQAQNAVANAPKIGQAVTNPLGAAVGQLGRMAAPQVKAPNLQEIYKGYMQVRPQAIQAARDFSSTLDKTPVIGDIRKFNKQTFGPSGFEKIKGERDPYRRAELMSGLISPGTIAGPKVVKQVFRGDKINLSTPQLKTLEGVRTKLGLTTRKVRSFDQMKEMAEELGTDPVRLLDDVQKGRITDAEVVALGNQVNNSTARIAKLTSQLKRNPGNSGIMDQIDLEERVLNQALRKRITGGTEAGRSVAAFKIIANKNLDPVYWLSKAQRQLGEERPLTPEMISAVNQLIKSKDRLGLANFISTLGESTGGEKAIALWKAGLLTSFRTHEANMISNAAFAGLETAKDIPATAFDMVRSGLTGTPRAKGFGLQTITSQGAGAVRGAKQAKMYLQEGIDPREIAKSEISRPIRFGDSAGGKLAQKYTNVVFRTLGAEDKIFREAAFNRSIADQAQAMAANGAGKLDDLIKNPTEDMVKQAVSDAEYSTFTNPNALSEAVRRAKSSSPTVGRVIDFIMPFVRTPTNVAKALFDYSPGGILVTTLKKVINGQSVSDRELANAFGRSTTGLALIVAGYQLAERGLVSGASPDKETERSQATLENRPANAILIGGQWKSIQRISPVGNLLVLGAEAHKAGLDPVKTFFAGVKGTTEQSFLQGPSAALKAVNEPEQGAQAYLRQAVGGVIPTIAANVAQGLDDKQRDTRADGVIGNVVNQVKLRTPGLRNTLPEKLNALGDTMPQEGGLAGALFDPLNSRTPSNDPLVKEFSRVGYNLNYTGDTIGKEKLTMERQRQYQQVAGKYIRNILPSVLYSPQYQAASMEDQRNLIERAVNGAKELARAELTGEEVDIAERTEKLLKPKAKKVAKGSKSGGSKAKGGGRRVKAIKIPKMKFIKMKFPKAKAPKKVKIKPIKVKARRIKPISLKKSR